VRRARTRQRGQSIIEFAVVIPLFLLVVFALIDFSRLLFTYVSITNGARELARSVTITANPMTTVVAAFNNLTIIGGTTSPASSVTFVPLSGGGSGSITCAGSTDPLCTIQVTTGPSTTPTCAAASVCLTPATGASGSATYTSSNFNYAFNSNGNGDFVMMTWLAPDQSGQQQGFIQVCRIPFTTSCAFPSGLTRGMNTDGFVQVDARYTFQFNPLFQTRLDGVIDVSFMRPSAQVTTTVRTYSE
jgi:Flp pilus assembly protein TadG